MMAEAVFSIQVDLNDPPPVSMNKAYTNGPRGRRLLSAEGRRFKDALAMAVATSTTEWQRAYDAIHNERAWASLFVIVYFEQLLTRTWKPATMGKSGALNPYQKKDASNYLKLIEDAVCKGSGIDDCCNLTATITKKEDANNPRTVVIYKIYRGEPP